MVGLVGFPQVTKVHQVTKPGRRCLCGRTPRWLWVSPGAPRANNNHSAIDCVCLLCLQGHASCAATCMLAVLGHTYGCYGTEKWRPEKTLNRDWLTPEHMWLTGVLSPAEKGVAVWAMAPY